jgi:predicted transcriptional regulator
VRESAEAIDRKVESISPELAAAIETAGYVHFLRRAIHRRQHLDQIEFVLK